MAKTIIVAGFGPGISSAVAVKFGAEGFQVALVARSASRLSAGVTALEKRGLTARAFTADLGDAASVSGMVDAVRRSLGSITVLFWNAAANAQVAGDMTVADGAAIRSLFDVPVVGLSTAVQAALPDLKTARDAALLVTNGGAGYVDPAVDARMVQFNLMGLAVSNAAKHKLVGLLAEKLKADGIYVGEIMVAGNIKGSAWDTAGKATIEGSAVAAKLWEMYTARKELRAKIS